MIMINFWQLIAAVIVLFVGVFLIVEYKLTKNNDVVSEFITLRDKSMKDLLLLLNGKLVDDIEDIDLRLRKLVNDDRQNKETN